MCGILAFFNSWAKEEAIGAFKILAERGKDNYGFSDLKESFHSLRKEEIFRKIESTKSKSVLLHSLHAVTGFYKQPIENSFIANCEIYNWKELAQRYSFSVKNDADLLYQLLKLKGADALKEVDGDYAFVYVSGNKIIAATDMIGVKPLFYRLGDGIAFASEQKALKGSVRLDPRKILLIDENKATFFDRDFISLKEGSPDIRITHKLLMDAVRKRVEGLDKFGILFSGGLDSTLLAAVCKRLGKRPTLYTAGMRDSKDMVFAKEAATALGLELVAKEAGPEEILAAHEKVNELLDENYVHLSIATTLYLACSLVKEKVILSGLGADELFAGYARFREKRNNEECLKSLLGVQRDLYRDDVISMHLQKELRVPFLDYAFAEHAVNIPFEQKIQDQNKHVLRVIGKEFGVPEAVLKRKKTAAQYGSGVDKALKKLM